MSQPKSKPDPIIDERYRQFKAAIGGSVLWMTKSEASATFKIPMSSLDRRLNKDGLNYVHLRKKALADYVERELAKGRAIAEITETLQISRVTVRKLAESKGIRFSRGGSDRSRREELKKWIKKRSDGDGQKRRRSSVTFVNGESQEYALETV